MVNCIEDLLQVNEDNSVYKTIIDVYTPIICRQVLKKLIATFEIIQSVKEDQVQFQHALTRKLERKRG